MGRGRDRRLVQRRNQKILDRYYYWTEMQRLRFDDALKQLAENEFFLSEQRIWKIIKTSSKGKNIFAKKVKVPTITKDQLTLFRDEDFAAPEEKQAAPEVKQ